MFAHATCDALEQVDSRNIGVWRKCVSVRLDDMPDGWLARAGVAITAQTGEAVSNNHDIMSLEVGYDLLIMLSFAAAVLLNVSVVAFLYFFLTLKICREKILEYVFSKPFLS